MNTNPLFIQINNRPQKKPVYYVHFGPIVGNGGEKVLTLPAGTGYSQTPSSAIFNIESPSQFTVRGWFYPTAHNPVNGLASRTTFTGDEGDWAVGLADFGGPNMVLFVHLNHFSVELRGTTAIQVNTWYFVEVSYDSSLAFNNIKIFLNGNLESQGNYNAPLSNSSTYLILGAYAGTSNCFIGQMSEWEFCANAVRNISNYAPPAKIIPDEFTTLYYPMNEGGGRILRDRSGNGNNGVLQQTAAQGFSLSLNSRHLNNNLIDLPQEYATGPILNATQSRPILMGFPDGISQQIFPLAGKSSIGGASFSLLDKNRVITQMIKNYPMKNRVITIYGGFEDLDEGSYRIVFKGQVNDWQLSDDWAQYQFTLTDFQRSTKTQIFGAETQVALPMSKTDTQVFVKGIDGFAPQTDMGDGRGPVNYIRIDDEIIQYGAIQPAQNNSYAAFTGLIRARLGSSLAEHSANGDVKNVVLLEGNPIDIALQILTSTGTGTNGPYDVLAESQGCGIDQSFIDIQGFENQRDRFLSRDKYNFYQSDAVDAQQFLSDEIYTFENAYPIILDDGRMGLKVYSVNTVAFELPVLDDTNVLPGATFQANIQSQQGFFNEIDLDFDYQLLLDQFLFTQLNEDSGSQDEANEAATLSLQSHGIKSYGSFNGLDIVNRFANNVFKRYAHGAPQITVTCFLSQQLLNPGDQVLLNLSVLPNLNTGGRGGSNIVCEIISKGVDYASGKVSYTLLATGYNLSKKYGAITPQSILNGGTFPVYTSADAQQQQYAFAGKKIGVTTDVQSNGDPGTYITP